MATARPKLLVLEMRMLGDAVLSLPFLRGAMAKCDVHVCCNPASADLLGRVVPRDRLITWTAPWLAEEGKYRWSRWTRAGVGALVGQLRSIKADMVVSVWPDVREHVLMAMSGAGVRAGFPMNRMNYLAHERTWRRKHLSVGRILSVLAGCALARPLLTQKLQREHYMQSHLDDWRQLAASLGIKWDTSPPWFAPDALDPTKFGAIVTLCRDARTRGEKVWLLHPGARLPSKRWPLERFQELVDTFFAARGMPLIIIRPPDGDAPEPRHARHVAASASSAGELAAIMNCADAVLCNDSAASHIAAALGKRVVSIFSSGHPAWFGPHGSDSHVIRSDACASHPCMDRCEMPSYVCQETVTTNMVREKLESLCRN